MVWIKPLKMAQIVSFYYIQLDWMRAICKEQYYHKKKKSGTFVTQFSPIENELFPNIKR